MSSREPTVERCVTIPPPPPRLEGENLRQNKKLLPVKPGQLGLRQSDAVFHHVQQLPDILAPLLEDAPALRAVGVSDRPRAQEGSYMPCFTVGLGAARMLAAQAGAALHRFSHQAGHIAAALYSAGRLDLLEGKFLAFHVSGGTTEAVLVTPDQEEILHAEIVARSLDLKGGQAVDRTGVLFGASLPRRAGAGKAGSPVGQAHEGAPGAQGLRLAPFPASKTSAKSSLTRAIPKRKLPAIAWKPCWRLWTVCAGLCLRNTVPCRYSLPGASCPIPFCAGP